MPSENVTGPAGMTVGDMIFAVKVTTCPRVEGLGDDVTVAVLFAWKTFCKKTVICC